MNYRPIIYWLALRGRFFTYCLSTLKSFFLIYLNQIVNQFLHKLSKNRHLKYLSLLVVSLLKTFADKNNEVLKYHCWLVVAIMDLIDKKVLMSLSLNLRLMAISN